jgi:hypothetical protein
MLQGPLREPRRRQLRARHDAVLPPRERRHRPIRVHFFPLVKARATRGKLCTQDVPFFPLAKRAMSKGKKCTLSHAPQRAWRSGLTPSMPQFSQFCDEEGQFQATASYRSATLPQSTVFHHASM